jgi:hypothetical protein
MAQRASRHGVTKEEEEGPFHPSFYSVWFMDIRIELPPVKKLCVSHLQRT